MDDVALTKLLCQLLGDIPGWTWRVDSEYSANETGIFYGPIAEAPVRAIGVRVYGSTDDRENHLSSRRAQLRFRGRPHHPHGADELASTAFTRLQGLSRVGGISDISRLSMAPQGADTNGRDERTDNYIIILDNPEATTS